jgi:YVTN family beta-propeller protein
MNRRSAKALAAWAAALLCTVAGASFAAAAGKDKPAVPGAVTDRLVRNGVAIDFTMTPAGAVKALTEGEFADLRFRIADEASGQPVRSSTPGVWMDMTQVIQGRGTEQKSCKDKIALYLKGVVGIRPMVDLNSYFVVLMNNDSTISVVAPTVSMAGATSTFASLLLAGPGADWVAAGRERRLYVSMPRINQVAVIDTDNFKVVGNIDAGKTPLRLALQPDGRYLWVGNNAADEAASGVTLIDTRTQKAAGFVATGAGHHEIAFSSDSRYAFVSNRTAGTVAVVDVASRKLLKKIATGAQPLSVVHSPLSRALYVADGKDGKVTVIDAARHEVLARIALEPGLGPLRTTPDGRFALAINSQQDLVHVIDTATNEHVQDVKIPGQPFQLIFTATYAYVRSLHSERVHMIALASLGKGRQAAVQHFAAGAQAPGRSGAAIADSVATAASEGTVFVVNPADGTTYYYQEGMNAPSSNYRVYGSTPRAVTVVDRSVKEVEPGVYEGRVRIPVAGKYDVAFMLSSPQVLHCFSADAGENPRVKKEVEPLTLEFATAQRQFEVGQTAAVRFKLMDGATGQPRTGLAGVRSLHFLAPGRNRTETAVVEIGEGVYEARLKLTDAGAWYVHVGVPTLKVGYERLPYFSLMASAPAEARPAAARP